MDRRQVLRVDAGHGRGRHVEVYARYLTDKMPYYFPINVHLRSLLDDVVADSRWDMTYLGMQIMIEGLAKPA